MLAPWATDPQTPAALQRRYDQQAVLQPAAPAPEPPRRSRMHMLLQAPSSSQQLVVEEGGSLLMPSPEPSPSPSPAEAEQDTCALSLTFHQATPSGGMTTIGGIGGALEAFGLSTDGDILHAYQKPSTGWTSWSSLRGPDEPSREFVSGPALVPPPRPPHAPKHPPFALPTHPTNSPPGARRRLAPRAVRH